MKWAAVRHSAFTRAFAIVAAILLSSSAVLAQAPATPEQAAIELTGLAVEAFERGNPAEAEQKLREALKRSETTFEAHFWLGRVFAQRAGSSPEARREAVTHFRRALQLQPFGESGDLTRDWLLHVGGRPRSVLLVEALDPEAKQHDSDATRRVVAEVRQLAAKHRFEVMPFRREGSPDVVDLGRERAPDLVKRCQDEAGALRAGWLVAVSVDDLEISRGRSGAQHASGTAHVRVLDPVANRMLPAMALRPAAFDLLSVLLRQSNSSREVREHAVHSLAMAVWEKIRILNEALADPALLDETLFPLPIPGAYGRAAAPYAEAIKFPLVLLAPLPSAGDAFSRRQDAANRIIAGVQQELLKSAKVSVLSPGNTLQALQALGLSAGPTPDGLAAVARKLHCRYMIRLTPGATETRLQNELLAKKVTLTGDLKLTVEDGATGEVVLTRRYDGQKTIHRFLPDDLTAQIIEKEAELQRTLQAEAAADLRELLAR